MTDVIPPLADERLATFSSEIVKRLRQSILRGELRPGVKLKLEALRESLGVTQSRGPLREALSRLGAEGLVVFEDQRGYRVAPISEKNLREIAKMRVSLETLALRESIANGGAAWEADLRSALGALAQVPRADGMGIEQHEAWETAHRLFHRRLIEGCDMPTLMQHVASIHDQNDRYRRLFLAHHPFDRDVRGEHAAIVEAALERNADLACALLARHVQRTVHNIAAAIGAASSRSIPSA